MKSTRIVLSVFCWLISFACGAQAADLIKREGKYIHLTTDIESTAEIDTLVSSFDAAVPQWLEFWNLTEHDVASWKLDACVIRDRDRFKNDGLIPGDVPDFPFGFTLDDRCWVLVQKSDYYTRHLLLHEGAHSLAFHKWQGAGPTWFMEGTAEMLATHTGVGADVTINQIPANRDQVPYWGRFKLMNQLRNENKVPSIATVMRYQPNLLGQVDAYGWSWAATMMMQAYPEYRDTFMSSARNGRDTSSAFNRRMFLQLQTQWPVFNARWRMMCHDLDYGFDWDIEPIEISERDPIWNSDPISLDVHSNLGWQSVGVRIPPGASIKLTAVGTITLVDQPKPWTSEPEGITYQYNRGRPIGQLVACVLPNATVKSSLLPELTTQKVGQQTTVDIGQFSWLMLRVNDSVAGQSDNAGVYTVTVTTP